MFHVKAPPLAAILLFGLLAYCVLLAESGHAQWFPAATVEYEADLVDEDEQDSDADEEDAMEVRTVPMRGIQYVQPEHDPNLEDSGDIEFDGNGPVVVVRGAVFIYDRTKIVRRLTMTAAEPGGDYSFGHGSDIGQTIYTAPEGYEIVEILTTDDKMMKRFPEPLLRYVDNNHSADIFETEYGTVTCYGDQYGDDLSSRLNQSSARCRCKVEWDFEFEVLIMPVDYSYNLHHVRLPQVMTLGFEHGGHGDLDFHGNGPKMTLTALLSDGASNAITFGLYGSAVETGGDCTSGIGYEGRTLFEAPAGYEIVEVLDGLGSPMGGHDFGTLLRSNDLDHDVSIFNWNELGTYRVFGDHRGDDLNGYARIEMYSANLNVVVVTRRTSTMTTTNPTSGTLQSGDTVESQGTTMTGGTASLNSPK